ncbi:POK19 protein, partial [Brachypodius atriceps]|nr:POK19 protein [Brachypodius atriceps]
APVQLGGLPNIFQQAKLSHQQFHQDVPGLIHQFHLRQDQAKEITDTCPNCQKFSLPSLGSGLNPRGLGSCKVWQTDIM